MVTIHNLMRGQSRNEWLVLWYVHHVRVWPPSPSSFSGGVLLWNPCWYPVHSVVLTVTSPYRCIFCKFLDCGLSLNSLQLAFLNLYVISHSMYFQLFPVCTSSAESPWTELFWTDVRFCCNRLFWKKSANINRLLVGMNINVRSCFCSHKFLTIYWKNSCSHFQNNASFMQHQLALQTQYCSEPSTFWQLIDSMLRNIIIAAVCNITHSPCTPARTTDPAPLTPQLSRYKIFCIDHAKQSSFVPK